MKAKASYQGRMEEPLSSKSTSFTLMVKEIRYQGAIRGGRRKAILLVNGLPRRKQLKDVRCTVKIDLIQGLIPDSDNPSVKEVCKGHKDIILAHCLLKSTICGNQAGKGLYIPWPRVNGRLPLKY